MLKVDKVDSVSKYTKGKKTDKYINDAGQLYNLARTAASLNQKEKDIATKQQEMVIQSLLMQQTKMGLQDTLAQIDLQQKMLQNSMAALSPPPPLGGQPPPLMGMGAGPQASPVDMMQGGMPPEMGGGAPPEQSGLPPFM